MGLGRAAAAAATTAAASFSTLPAPPADAESEVPALAEFDHQLGAATAASADDPVAVAAAAGPFDERAVAVLMAPLNMDDVEVKPDGQLYLPEIKFRRILNTAFRPGGWSLVPRGPHTITAKSVSREYALYCLGRYVSQARGEQAYFNSEGVSMATEGCRSKALVRCCKDLGIASELWDPAWLDTHRATIAEKVVAASYSGARKVIWKRKDRPLPAGFRAT